jgi:hypothetical protein
MPAITVLIVSSANNEPLPRHAQGLSPLPGSGARLWRSVPPLNCVPKKNLKRWFQNVQRRGDPFRPNETITGIGVRKKAKPDTILPLGRIAASQILAVERMNPFHQQLEDQHLQPEVIVLRFPVHAGERHALHLRRRVVWRSHRAAVHLRPVRIPDLEGVRINQRRQRLVVHQEVALIHVAHYMTVGMNGFYCRGAASGPSARRKGSPGMSTSGNSV